MGPGGTGMVATQPKKQVRTVGETDVDSALPMMTRRM
jgi:hypothetical protein